MSLGEILLDDNKKDSTIKLANFRFAHFEDDNNKEIPENPYHVAPEILRNEKPTTMVDVWSVIVYSTYW